MTSGASSGAEPSSYAASARPLTATSWRVMFMAGPYSGARPRTAALSDESDSPRRRRSGDAAVSHGMWNAIVPVPLPLCRRAALTAAGGPLLLARDSESDRLRVPSCRHLTLTHAVPMHFVHSVEPRGASAGRPLRASREARHR